MAPSSSKKGGGGGPHHQSSLDSFFGSAKAGTAKGSRKAPKSKQKKMESFFGSRRKENNKTEVAAAASPSKRKARPDDEEEPTAAAAKVVQPPNKKKVIKRRVIDDDDSSSDDEGLDNNKKSVAAKTKDVAVKNDAATAGDDDASNNNKSGRRPKTDDTITAAAERSSSSSSTSSTSKPPPAPTAGGVRKAGNVNETVNDAASASSETSDAGSKSNKAKQPSSSVAKPADGVVRSQKSKAAAPESKANREVVRNGDFDGHKDDDNDEEEASEAEEMDEDEESVAEKETKKKPAAKNPKKLPSKTSGGSSNSKAAGATAAAPKSKTNKVVHNDDSDGRKDDDNNEEEASEAEEMDLDQEEEEDISVAEKETKKKPAAKNPKKLPSKTSGSSSNSKVTGAKGQYKSDDAILRELDPSLTWDGGGDVPYALLCRAFGQIEAVQSRLAIQEILTTLFRQIMLHSTQVSEDLRTVLYLASNSVAPAYECVELGIGDSILTKAIGQATGTAPARVRERYETVGDLGLVVQTLKSKQRTLGGFFGAAAAGGKSAKKKKQQLTAAQVWKTFRQIAETKGGASQKLKVDLVQGLLVRAATDAGETKYIVRGLQGKLRIGLAQSTVLISLAHALALSPPRGAAAEAESGNDGTANYPEEAKQYMDQKLPMEKRLEAAVAIVKRAYSEVPSYEAILEAALKVPLQYFHRECTLTPGIPVSPMLAKPTKSVQEVLKRLNGLDFTLEYKYDGERAQVHMLPDGTTRVFSRNLLDTSEKYPEVPAFVKEAGKNVESFVLDAEVVAFNRETGKLVPFQVLSTRKKTEESAETAKVQVIVQAFDLMFLNGKSLLDHTLAERRALLREHFQPVEGKFQFATSMDHKENGDTTLLEEFLEAAVKNQCEGLMVKTLEVNAIYEPSRRSLNWLKLKKDYQEGLGDSVDLVPIGAYHGRGKRTGFYGAYLLAVFDPESEEFQSVCKIGTGFSDEDLKSLSDELNKHKIPKKSSEYNTSDALECDVWFDAVQVWEVKAADLSKSPVHRGAIGMTGEAGRGIGLRFPRFERLRDDKRPVDATTSHQIWDMYLNQDAIAGGDSNTNNDDDDDEGI